MSVPEALRRPFLIAVLVSLVLTGVRLAGEVGGGPDWLFGRAAGGGGALLGLGWLIPVVGAWFGWRLSREQDPPMGRGPALGRVAVGLAGVAVVFTLSKVVLGVSLGTFLFAAATLPLLMTFALRAWPRLAHAMLLYALAVRLPVCAITVFAVRGNWGTHYEQLAPGSPAMGDVARTVVLCTAQLCLWISLTVQIGCLAGLLAMRRPGRSDRIGA